MNIFESVTIIRNEQKPLYALKVGEKFGFTIPNEFPCVICEPINERITYKHRCPDGWVNPKSAPCDETVLVWCEK